MSTHNIGFNEDLTKISLNYHQISSNAHLISSADVYIHRIVILLLKIYFFFPKTKRLKSN